MDRMEIVDIITLGIAVVILAEAYTRFKMLRSVKEFAAPLAQQERQGKWEKSTSYWILDNPVPESPWKPGIGSYLDAKPMLLLIAVVIVLGFAASIVGMIVTTPRLVLALLAISLALAFHSAPDRFTLSEYYLKVIQSEDIVQLDGHDFHAVTHTHRRINRWTVAQAMFAISIMLSVFLPIEWQALYLVGLLLATFFFLGIAYQVGKGVYAER